MSVKISIKSAIDIEAGDTIHLAASYVKVDKVFMASEGFITVLDQNGEELSFKDGDRVAFTPSLTHQHDHWSEYEEEEPSWFQKFRPHTQEPAHG